MNDNIQGYTYLRCVILKNDNLPYIGESNKVFGKTICGKTLLKAHNTTFGYFKHKSSTNPPLSLKNRVTSNNNDDSFLYDIYVSDVTIKKENWLLVAAPHEDLIKEIIQEELFFYAKCELRKICNEQYFGHSNVKVKLSRLHARIHGEPSEAVTTIALYGDNVLSSKVIRDILGQKLSKTDEKQGGPFMALGSKRLEPNSCKLVWNESEKSDSLNLDRFGNYSFSINERFKTDDFNNIINILSYIDRIGAFDTDSHINPLKRSKKSLKDIE